MRQARYDAIADFFQEGWPDAYDDSVSVALFEEAGVLSGLNVLDVACGHGRMTRELARRGAKVLGIDISTALITKAEAAERNVPLGVNFRSADVCAGMPDINDASFDLSVCCFGLSDIDDLDAALHGIARVLRPGGRFVFAILHPCFPGAGEVSGAWPTNGSYYEEGWWVAQGERSSLRRHVGANHRMLSTYINALGRHGLGMDRIAEPEPPEEWAASRGQAGSYPVFLVGSCVRTEGGP